ncbi:MAG: DedA family protein [Candidatus Pacebacteria bacterium]|nr:DedA family protein [Candidatus Paceibacterota bacterium]
MFEFLINFFVKIVETGGYPGIVFLMALESTAMPLPSEAIMPFAGFLWFLGKMSFGWIIFFSTIGSIIGSLLSYFIGFYAGEPFIKKFGKYFLINEEHLEATEKFFKKFGSKTILFSRFIPVIRHLISLPAGIGKMNLLKFSSYTILGAGIWNAFLTYLGYYLGENWAEIRKFSEIIDIAIIILILGTAVFLIMRRVKARAKINTL